MCGPCGSSHGPGPARARVSPCPGGAGFRLEARDLGYKCSVVFLVQFDFARVFRPNGSMDPAFARALTDAAKAGVNLYAVGCHVDLETIEPTYTLPIDLEVSGDE